jgi:hypothetical protein
MILYFWYTSDEHQDDMLYTYMYSSGGPVQSLVWSAVGLVCGRSRVRDRTRSLVFGLGGLGPMVLVPDRS